MSELAKRAEVEQMPEAHRPTSIFDIIQTAALRPDVDIDKMERLYAMHERELARQARLAFDDAFAAAQAEMRPVAKKAFNDQTRSKYAKLEHIAEDIDPIIAKHGFSKRFFEADSPKEGHIRIVMRLSGHGHSEEYHGDVPIDGAGMKGNANKTPTHAFGSTVSYGRRYVKLLAFDIATGDDNDGNARPDNSAGPISAEQFMTLRDRIEALGVEVKFLAAFGIGALEELPATKFAAAMRVLDQTEANRKAKGDA